MWMTTDEMVQSYLNAQDQTKQVQVLSELNACSKEDIVKVLQSSQRLKGKIVGGGRCQEPVKPDRMVQLLQDEIRNAYSLCLKLEEENRRLQHEAIGLMKDMLVKLTSGQ